ncbi:MAG: alpha/beta hydrolase [Candidatus Acidiferrales bacterium]|jgi:endo-1,4-beta-xylanase
MRIRTLPRLKMCLMFALAASCVAASAQQPVVPLWPNGAPGSEGKTAPETVRISPQGDHVISNVNNPSITLYIPAAGKATGAGVVVMPGGGHSELWIDHEGYRVAAWLSDHGVAAFVLKYRLARAPGSTYTIEGTELQDAQRAIRLIRSRAAEWGVDPNRIGVMGFSAGGELAALAATRYDAGNAAAADPIDRQNSKPAFQALLYPAIPENMPLSKDTPPAFLACGADDRQNISEGVPELYLAMKRAGASAELHVFAGVGHGFGMRSTNSGNMTMWPDLFYGWLGASGFLKSK